MLGTQPFEGINLQVYDGGHKNKPGGWAKALNGIADTGIADFGPIVWPIFAMRPGGTPNYTPKGMTDRMEEWHVHGASWWNTFFLTKEEATDTMSDFAAAIAAGSR